MPSTSMRLVREVAPETMRTARFSSPLGVYDFQKRSSVIEVSREGAQALGRIGPGASAALTPLTAALTAGREIQLLPAGALHAGGCIPRAGG